MRTTLFGTVTQRVVVITYQVSRQPIGPIFKGQWSLPLKMGPIGCPETSGRSYHYSFRNSPEEHTSDLQSLYAYDWVRRQMKLETILFFLIVQHLERSLWVPPNAKWDNFCVRPAAQFAYRPGAESPSYPSVILLCLYTQNNIKCVLDNDWRVSGYGTVLTAKYYPVFLRSLLPPASGSTQHKTTSFLSMDTSLRSMRLDSLSAPLWESQIRHDTVFWCLTQYVIENWKATVSWMYN